VRSCLPLEVSYQEFGISILPFLYYLYSVVKYFFMIIDFYIF
jgi:hypothetical protein